MKTLLIFLALASLWATAAIASGRKHAQYLRRLASERREHSLETFIDQLIQRVVEAVAARCGRSIEENQPNPYRGKFTTVSDIIGYVSSQPRRPLDV